MPRLSAQARGAAIYRSSQRPLRKPPEMGPGASKIWDVIVATRPIDFFVPGDEILLARFCAISARAAEIEAALQTMPVDSKDAPRLERRLTALVGTASGVAARLRLTPQARIERHSGIRNEVRPPPPWGDDPLLGGAATRRDRQ